MWHRQVLLIAFTEGDQSKADFKVSEQKGSTSSVRYKRDRASCLPQYLESWHEA